ncbi:unnamed protein product [marine sediment metagenome]|uniref:Uncharacterized protein n=1 Tax=marine sediment metagenome TaxID=412755 RepID=X1UXX1_9ZZZZ
MPDPFPFPIEFAYPLEYPSPPSELTLNAGSPLLMGVTEAPPRAEPVGFETRAGPKVLLLDLDVAGMPKFTIDAAGPSNWAITAALLVFGRGGMTGAVRGPTSRLWRPWIGVCSICNGFGLRLGSFGGEGRAEVEARGV